MVLQPYEEIGVYGGTARVFTKRPSPAEDVIGFISHEGLLKLGADDATFVPNIAKSYEWSSDGRVITMTLRKGMKWSDGDDFDTDDLRFWYEDVLGNEELTPVWPGNWKTAGGPMELEVVDDVTFRMKFKDPYPLVMNLLGHYAGVTIVLPSHYLKEFHIKYNSKANDLAKEGGYETWVQLYAAKSQLYQGSVRCSQDVNVPTLYDYVMTEKGTDHWVFERNPYYWKVDTVGNQLPYIDRVFLQLTSNNQIINAKIISGETDWANFNTSLDNYTMYKESEGPGNYRVLLWSRPVGAFPVLMFNQTYEADTVLRDIFRDVRFRKAMSVAINRDEINDALFFGRAVPRQQTVDPSSKYYKQEFADAYANYDVEEANSYLDAMGLKWNADKKWRLRPDGKPLTIVLEYGTIGGAAVVAVVEMVQQYWAKVGVNLVLKEQSGELIAERVPGNQAQAGLWVGEHITDVLFPPGPRWFLPFNNGWENCWAPQWGLWYHTGGVEGEEPPAEVRRNQELWDKMKTTVDVQENIRIGQEILQSQAENLWTIGTVGLPPHPVVVRNNLRNVPEEGMHAWDNFWGQSYYPEQRFFKPPLMPMQK